MSKSNGDDDAVAALDVLLKEKLNLSKTGEEQESESSNLVNDTVTTAATKPLILCDMAYGIPKEARPRKEKLLAIARQLVNFLSWQQQQRVQENHSTLPVPPADVQVVACPDDSVADALYARMKQLWKEENNDEQSQQLPAHFDISTRPLEDWLPRQSKLIKQENDEPSSSNHHNQELSCCCYLSPDATDCLDPAADPPRIIVVGLLIDRRTILVNKSLLRADGLSIPAARWPLETVSDVLSVNEPLNVDCVLEGMQQWYWNCSGVDNDTTTTTNDKAWRFQDAAIQALQRHQQRHPGRPQHKATS